jgi:hypothetical protein
MLLCKNAVDVLYNESEVYLTIPVRCLSHIKERKRDCAIEVMHHASKTNLTNVLIVSKNVVFN